MQYNFMFVFKNYDRQNHVLSFMTKLISDFYVILRVEVGKHPQVILAMYFYLKFVATKAEISVKNWTNIRGFVNEIYFK